MRKPPWLWVIAGLAAVLAGSSWYIGFVNRTHPAPWPMAFGDAGGRHLAPAPLPSSPKVLWTYPLESIRWAAPVVGEDGTIYLAGDEGLLAVGSDGKKRWAWRGQEPLFSAAIGRQGTVYVQDVTGLYALDAQGQMQWQAAIESGCCGSLLVGQGGVIYVSSREYLYAFLDNGQLKWRFKGGRIVAGPAETPEGLVVIIVGTELYAIKPSGDLAWQQTLEDPQRYETLLAGTDGRIYVKGRALSIVDADGKRIRQEPVKAGLLQNLAMAKGFLQEGLVRRNADGKELWAAGEPPGRIFLQTIVDGKGNALFLQSVLDRDFVRQTPEDIPPLMLLDKEAQVGWAFRQANPITTAAVNGNGHVCFVGRVVPQNRPSLVCIGNE